MSFSGLGTGSRVLGSKAFQGLRFSCQKFPGLDFGHGHLTLWQIGSQPFWQGCSKQLQNELVWVGWLFPRALSGKHHVVEELIARFSAKSGPWVLATGLPGACGPRLNNPAAFCKAPSHKQLVLHHCNVQAHAQCCHDSGAPFAPPLGGSLHHLCRVPCRAPCRAPCRVPCHGAG